MIIKAIKKEFNVEVIDFAKTNFWLTSKNDTNKLSYMCSWKWTSKYCFCKRTGIVEILPYDYSIPITKMTKACADGLGIYYRKVDGGNHQNIKMNILLIYNKILKTINNLLKINIVINRFENEYSNYWSRMVWMFNCR